MPLTIELDEQTAAAVRQLAANEKRTASEVIFETRRRQGRCGIGTGAITLAGDPERLGIQRLFTLDERHFRTIKPRNFPHFILLPADAP